MRSHHALLYLLLLAGSLPVNAHADHWQVANLAQQLESASDRLAYNVTSLRGYGSVSHHAQQLSRRAEQLAHSAARENSSAYLRSRFSDVARYYHSLETAFLRAGRNHHVSYLHDDFGHIAVLYNDLSRLLVYGSHPFPQYDYPDRYSYAPGRGPGIFAPPLRGNDRLSDWRPDRDDRDYFRNDSDRNDRHDHRSPVIERQSRRDEERAARDNHTGTETRRENHFEGNNGSYRLGRP